MSQPTEAHRIARPSGTFAKWVQAGIGCALSGVGEDEGGVEALRGVDEKGSAGAKRVHEALSWRPYSAAKDNFSISFVRKA